MEGNISEEQSNTELFSPKPSVNQNQTHVPAWIIIILLLINLTTPVALFFMFREKRYHSWFPILLWVCAGFWLLFLAVFGIFVLPQISTLSSSLGISSTSVYIPFILGVLLVIVQIASGFILKKKLVSGVGLSKKSLWLAVIILVIGWCGIAISIITSISQILKIVSSIQ
ncbi:MAG TPA: hypothetical protein VNW29_02015 [Candidatus Sulfotelmatobacter sp.]|jgi:hypothetical protein|nr:hypothetical protein [Candidatus Sulfotelmatobacter sp.]